MQFKAALLALAGASTLAAAYNPYDSYSLYARGAEYDDGFDSLYAREADAEAEAEAIADALNQISDVVRRSADPEPFLPFLKPVLGGLLGGKGGRKRGLEAREAARTRPSGGRPSSGRPSSGGGRRPSGQGVGAVMSGVGDIIGGVGTAAGAMQGQ